MKSKTFAYIVVFSILALLSFVYSGNAASPNVTVKSGHIPTYHGIKQIWFSNDPTVNVAVNLSFTPPWDLTSGPKQKKFTQLFVETSDAFDGNKFPDASFATEKTQGGQKAYQFFKKSSTGLFWLGSSTPPSNPDIANFSFAPEIRMILLPAKLGKTATQTSNLVSAGGNVPLKITVKIVGKGTLIVAAGTFNDAVMVQQKVELTGQYSYIQYQWYAPFIGPVAEIRSLDGETKELFTTASEFYWLKSCTMP